MSIIKLNNKAVSNATAIGSISSLGSMVFIKKLTASSSATLSFVDGTDGVVLDDTYKEYLFTFKNIHPATDTQRLTFQADTGTNTSYNQTMTTTVFRAYHDESDTATALQYRTGEDQAQGTSFQMITDAIGNGNDESASGYLHIFNPSSDTFVKHFVSSSNAYLYADYSVQVNTAGYFNLTTALTRFRFKMESGNIDAGDICLYGIA